MTKDDKEDHSSHFSKDHQKAPNKQELLRFGIEFALIIALPLIILVVPAVYLDKVFNTLPLCIIAAFLISILISLALLYRRIRPFL